MSFEIKYGIQGSYMDITAEVLNTCVIDNQIYIPSGDAIRAHLFGDPLPGILKHIHINDNGNNKIYLDSQEIELPIPKLTPEIELSYLHQTLNFVGGNIKDEYPEQLMSMIYIKPKDKVLEIGSNLGRNTLIISSLLEDSSQLVTLECNPQTYKMLMLNRNMNRFHFRAESKALSARPLILSGWNTEPGDLKPGYVKVDTITFQELVDKYGQFDTLVVDCEGALYYILQDCPELLTHINKVIMENDYNVLMHKLFIDDLLIKYEFKRDYVQGGGWGPCANFFYEVWIK